MDDCFGDTAIDEDEIVFDFGDGDFELKQSIHQDPFSSYHVNSDSVPTIEGLPELHPWSDPVKDQTPKIKDFNLDIKEKDVKTDSSHVLSSNDENLFTTHVSAHDDGVILDNSVVTSSGILPQKSHLSSNSTTSHLENIDNSSFPLSRALSGDDNKHHSENIFQSSDIFSLSISHAFPPAANPAAFSPAANPVAFPPVANPPSFHPVTNPVAFNPLSINPLSSPAYISPAFPPSADPLFPPASILPSSSPASILPSSSSAYISPAFPLLSIPQHPPYPTPPAGHDLTQPSETSTSSSSFQVIEGHASPPFGTISIQPSSSFSNPPPATNPFHPSISPSPPPHLNDDDDDDDDEFDFDELVASRTHFKPPTLQQTSTNAEVLNEMKNEFPSDDTFDADFSLKTDEIETTLAEDNRISVLHPGQRLAVTFDDDEVTDEWDTVQTIEPEFNEGQTRILKAMVGTEPITFAEAVAVLDRNKLTQQFGSSIKTSVMRGFVSSIFHRLCGGPRLQQRLHAERDFAFCLAACPFINDDSIHCRVLFSIYKQLTGSKFDCARFGSHWEIIGFQGHDPSTDLRGVGFLALLQLLHLVTDLKTQALARSIYRLSLHETQNFPFCVMGINLTRITVAAMREDCLNKECNRRDQLLGVLNDFYVGLFHRMHFIWKTQRKTIRDTGFVLADLELYAKKNSQEMVRTNIQSTVEAGPFQRQDGSASTRDIAHIDENLF